MAINKKRLQGAAESTAIVPSENFQTVLYTGNGATTQSITGVGFSADFIWIKARSFGASHSLQDTVRGVGAAKTLNSDNNSAEGTNGIYGFIASFDTDGFTVNLGSGTGAGHVNKTDVTYVAWCFKSGSTKALNEEGTIDSQVSANVAAGFSIVNYTANGTDGDSVGHSLSSPPQMIIYKGLNATGDWVVLTTAIDGSADYLFLNTTAAKGDYPSAYIPTSTTFASISSSSTLQTIAYCFHSVDGYSKVGSYEGTFLAGNDVECGFEPAWVMVKNADATGNWIIVDNKRNPTNQKDKFLYPNEGVAEGDLSAYDTIDFTTTGFVLQDHTDFTGSTNINVSGQTYIFYAIAADPDTTTPTLATSFGVNTYTGNGGTQSIGSVNTLFTKYAIFNGSNSGISVSTQPIPAGSTSISFWYNGNGNSGTQYILGNGIATASKGVTVYFSNNAFGALVAKGTSALAGSATGTNIYSNLDWHHIVFTWDGTSNSNAFKVYVNGVFEVQGTSDTSSASIGTYTSFAMGALGGGTYAAGKLDQLRIYNTVLNQTAVTSLYNETTLSASELNYPTGLGGLALYEFTGNANSTPTTYNGADSNVTYDSMLFKPDLVIIKNRSSSNQNWYWADSVRGVSQQLRSDSDGTENDDSPYGITAFNNAGFTVSDVTAGNNNVNGAVGGTWSGNAQFVAYSLKMLDNNNNVPIENSVGTIDSQVSANPSAGMSIVKYTGTGSTGSVGHGLSLAPEFIIAKNLDGTNSWVVRSSELGNGYLQLNDTTEYSTTVLWGTPTASVFNFTHDANGQINGNSYIAYCFHSVAGFSKFGSYTGTGSTGNAITTGFKPDFLMIKNTSSTGQWVVYDSKRDTTNAPETDTCLFMNLTDAEFSASDINISFDNNGFTLKGNNGNINGSSSPTTTTYLYWAMKIN